MIHAAAHKAPLARFGYRGRALTLIGLVWALVGISVYVQPVHDPDSPFVIELLPLWLRVGLWAGAATAALVTAWWPAGADRFGFMALVIPAALRCGSYSWDAVLGLASGGRLGDTGAWVSAVAWGVIVAFVLLVASWPEPGEVRADRITRR